MRLLISIKSNLLYISMILIIVLVSGCSKENVVANLDNEENGDSLDMLTPAYYQSTTEASFIEDVNQFISFAQLEQFHHPLEDETGRIPDFTVPPIGEFGAGKGLNGTSQHHPAVDLHVGNKEILVNIYASYDGFVTTVKNADKYRHYVSISKNVEDGNGQLIGKLVTLYAHIDLDLDEADSLNINEQHVNKGDIISKHLYSGTLGGPHLHFEIRYYRAGDNGTETFYGFANPNLPELTEPSAGNWSYGVWNPTVGYGFGNPISHGLDFQ